MKHLIHGDDIAASRKFLLELTDGYSVTFLEGKSLTQTQLEEQLLSGGLFGDDKGIVVENMISQNAKKKDLSAFINLYKGETFLILWEGKKLTKTQSNTLKNTTIHEFSYPTIYFQFLDSFTQGNGRMLYGLYHDLLKITSEELVFYSLLKRLRLLVVLSTGGTVTDLSKMAPWQVDKLKQQLQRWKKDALLSFYKSLQETEIKLKTGGLPIGLSKHLDILILSRLT